MSTAKGGSYILTKKYGLYNFWKGKETLVMIPDLGDGLKHSQENGTEFIFVYRHLGKSIKYMYSVVSMSYPKNILQKTWLQI